MSYINLCKKKIINIGGDDDMSLLNESLYTFITGK